MSKAARLFRMASAVHKTAFSSVFRGPEEQHLTQRQKLVLVHV